MTDKKPETVTLDRTLFDQIMDLLDRHDYCQGGENNYYANCRECGAGDGYEHRKDCPFYQIAHHPQIIALEKRYE